MHYLKYNNPTCPVCVTLSGVQITRLIHTLLATFGCILVNLHNLLEIVRTAIFITVARGVVTREMATTINLSLQSQVQESNRHVIQQTRSLLTTFRYVTVIDRGSLKPIGPSSIVPPISGKSLLIVITCFN